jgi:hypothetical protein
VLLALLVMLYRFVKEGNERAGSSPAFSRMTELGFMQPRPVFLQKIFFMNLFPSDSDCNLSKLYAFMRKALK